VSPTWDILIRSIVHRHAKLCDLLTVLNAQMLPGAGVLLHRDNLQTGAARKCQLLVEASRADYTCFVDDDDMVAADYIPRIMAALALRPDYVGFPVAWSIDGIRKRPAEHSLRHTGWNDDFEALTRDISHLNPIRRELALLGTWAGEYAEDHDWAAQVAATGQVKTEVWIDVPMYDYRYSTTDHVPPAGAPPDVFPPRVPMAPEDIPALPSYPWLTVLEAG
jgi:hypothetical protein